MAGVLFVCTANQIRSPVAERLTQAALRARFGPSAETVPVTSAGTQARPGYPIWPHAADELARRGITPAGHTSQLLTPQMLHRSDLVLTASRTHRDHAVGLFPAVHDRAFTLRELAWLLSGAQPVDLPGSRLPERLQFLPQLARRRRGYLQPIPPEALDIADPVGGPPPDFARAVAEIEHALAVAINVL